MKYIPHSLIALMASIAVLSACSSNASHSEVADWWYTATPETADTNGGVPSGTRETPYKGSSTTSVTNANNRR